MPMPICLASVLSYLQIRAPRPQPASLDITATRIRINEKTAISLPSPETSTLRPIDAKKTGVKKMYETGASFLVTSAFILHCDGNSPSMYAPVMSAMSNTDSERNAMIKHAATE